MMIVVTANSRLSMILNLNTHMMKRTGPSRMLSSATAEDIHNVRSPPSIRHHRVLAKIDSGDGDTVVAPSASTAAPAANVAADDQRFRAPSARSSASHNENDSNTGVSESTLAPLAIANAAADSAAESQVPSQSTMLSEEEARAPRAPTGSSWERWQEVQARLGKEPPS